MEGHPVVALNRAARVSERFRDGTESRGHGTRARCPSAVVPRRAPPPVTGAHSHLSAALQRSMLWSGG